MILVYFSFLGVFDVGSRTSDSRESAEGDKTPEPSSVRGSADSGWR